MAARKRRGVRPVCGRNIAVTWETDLVWPHGPNSSRCPGTNQPPAEEK